MIQYRCHIVAQVAPLLHDGVICKYAAWRNWAEPAWELMVVKDCEMSKRIAWADGTIMSQSDDLGVERSPTCGACTYAACRAVRVTACKYLNGCPLAQPHNIFAFGSTPCIY